MNSLTARIVLGLVWLVICLAAVPLNERLVGESTEGENIDQRDKTLLQTYNSIDDQQNSINARSSPSPPLVHESTTQRDQSTRLTIPLTETLENAITSAEIIKTTSTKSAGQKIEELPWLPLIILTFLITTACTCCKFVRCSSCDTCPMFEHRSEANNRYGAQRDSDAMRSLNKRFRATAGYPNHPAVDPFQKYIGNQRLRKYREPNVCIVDEDNKIVADTNDIYDSIHNSTYTYIKSNGSNDDMRKYKLDLEEKRRKNIERQEMIDRTKTTANHDPTNCHGFSIYNQQQLMIMSKRNTSNDLEAITENMDESRLTLAQGLLEDSNAPDYTSRENIFDYWKNKNNGSSDPEALENADKWSIHPPTLTSASTSEESRQEAEQVAPSESHGASSSQNESFQEKVAQTETTSFEHVPPEDEITAVECSSSIDKGRRHFSDYV